MTKEEAIKVLERRLNVLQFSTDVSDYCNTRQDSIDAIKMAIQSLHQNNRPMANIITK